MKTLITAAAIVSATLLATSAHADITSVRPVNPTPTVVKTLPDQPKSSSESKAGAEPRPTGQIGGPKSAPFDPVGVTFPSNRTGNQAIRMARPQPAMPSRSRR